MTREEPYIYDFIIVSLINKPGSQDMANVKCIWLKLTILVTENSWPRRYC